MANLDIHALQEFVDKRIGRGTIGAAVLATDDVYDNIAAMRTRLTAISATSYSAQRLDNMTANDMMYAIRLNDDAAGF